MASLKQTYLSYKNYETSKPEFIRKMYENHHRQLFDYADYLNHTNIKKIEISDQSVVMTSRDKDVKMLCVPGDFRIAPIETLNFLDYEKEDSDMIGALLTKCSVFFDIGANMGWYSIIAGLANPECDIHGFEPIPRTFEYFLKNIELNNLKNVNAHNIGLSDKVGQFEFFFYEEGSGNSSAVNVSNRSDVIKYNCNVSTLDLFTEQNGTSVDFIKCDVEGAELLVFEGGRQTIARDKPIVFSEILRKWSTKFDYDANQILEFFKERNYSVFYVDGNGLKPISRIEEDTIQTNFFFLHNEKHSEEISRFSSRREAL